MTVDPTYQDDEVDIPIENLVLDLARINDGEDEFRDQSWATSQLERREFSWVEPAFLGACLFVKTSRWPIQYLYKYLSKNEALFLLFSSK